MPATSHLDDPDRPLLDVLRVPCQMDQVVRHVAESRVLAHSTESVIAHLERKDRRHATNGEMLNQRVQVIVQSLHVTRRCRDVPNGVDDEAPYLARLDRLEDLSYYTVDLQLHRVGVDQLQPLLLNPIRIRAKSGDRATQLGGILLEVDEDRRLAPFDALERKLETHGGLAGSGHAEEQGRATRENSAVHQRIQTGHTTRQTLAQGVVLLWYARRHESWIELDTVSRDSKRVLPLTIPAAAKLENAEVALVASAQRLARQLDDRVGDGKFRIATDVVLGVLAEQESGDVVGGQQPGEARHEPPDFIAGHREVMNGPERVDDDDSGGSRFDGFIQPLDQRIRPVFGERTAQVLVLD